MCSFLFLLSNEVHNYDGSETKKTITRNRGGTETISEVTTYPDGKQIAREIIKHIASGKTSKYPFTLFLGNSQIQYMVCNNGQVYHCRTLVKTLACFKFSLFTWLVLQSARTVVGL